MASSDPATEVSERPFFHRWLQDPKFAIIVLFILTLVYSYPIVFHLSDHVIATEKNTDIWQFIWNQFVFREQVLHGKDPYFTDYFFHPVGTSLLFHSYTEFNSFFAVLLYPFLNDITIHNLLRLLSTFLTGVGMYLLAREVTRNSIASLFAAIAFAFCPFRMLRPFGHINFESTQWLPFALWAFIRMADTKRTLYALLTGLFFALAYYCDQYYVIFLALSFLLILAYGIWRFSEWRTYRLAILLLLAGAFALLFLFPVTVRFFHEEEVKEADTEGANLRLSRLISASGGDYFRPANAALQNLFHVAKFQRTEERMALTPGWTVLALASVGLWFSFKNRERRINLWVPVALGFFLLSLGPYLTIRGFSSDPAGQRILLPFYLMSKIPYANNARIATRFAVMVSLALALPAAYAVSLILTKLKGRSGGILALILFALLVLESIAIPVPMIAFDPPAVFYKLGKIQAEEVMISVPFDFDAFSSHNLLYQIIHKRKVLNGRISRRPWAQLNYFSGIPITRSLHNLNFTNVAEDREMAPVFRKFFNVRYLTLFPGFSNRPEILHYVEQVFPDAQLLADEKGIKVYLLPEMPMQEFHFHQDEKGIGFFLFDNWKLRWMDGRERIVSWENQAKFLLPEVKENQILRMRIRVRCNEKEFRTMNARLLVGDHVLSETVLTPEPDLWRFDVPGALLQKAHRLVTLQQVTAEPAGGSSAPEPPWKFEVTFIGGKWSPL